jgi:hypothetical protein
MQSDLSILAKSSTAKGSLVSAGWGLPLWVGRRAEMESAEQDLSFNAVEVPVS